MQAHRNGVPMLASSGYVAKVDAKKCIACGTCEQLCQFNAITMGLDGAVIDFNRCMGCGVCVNNCPEGALELIPEVSKGMPLDLKELSV